MSSNQGFIQQQDGQGKGKTNQKNLIGHHLFLGMGNRGALKAEDCEQKQQTGDGGQKVEIPKREGKTRKKPKTTPVFPLLAIRSGCGGESFPSKMKAPSLYPSCEGRF